MPSAPKKSSSSAKLLEIGLANAKAAFTAEADAKRRANAFDARRRKVSDKFRSKLIKNAMAAAGIDQAAITKLQQTDQAAVKAFLAKERKFALGNAKKVAADQKLRASAHLKGLKHHLPDPNAPGPNPPPQPVFEYLQTATNISFNEINDSAEVIYNSDAAPMANIVRASIDMDVGFGDGDAGNAGATLAVNWNFLWTAPRAGNLKLISFVQANGFVARAAHGVCFSDGTSATSLTTQISVLQSSASGSGITTSTPATEFDGNHVTQNAADCTSKHQSNPVVDDVPIIFDAGVFVGAGEAVLITVAANLFGSVYCGEAHIDFRTPGYQLNVPFVFVALE